MNIDLGQVVITQGVLALVEDKNRPMGFGMAAIHKMLRLHQSGDWGSVCPTDWETNNEAANSGGRILSAYAIDEVKGSQGWGDNTIWIITEWDRSVTTALLPDEY